MKLLASSLSALLLSVPLAYGQSNTDPYKNAQSPTANPPTETGPIISFEEEVFSLSVPDAVKLMREQTDDTARYKKAAELVEQGKAKRERYTILRTIPGERTVSESIVEFRYPTEFAIFGDEKKEQTSGKAELKAAEPTKDMNPAEAKAATQPPSSVGGTEVQDPSKEEKLRAAPTAFETRNVGDTVELLARVSGDRKTVDVEWFPSKTTWIGDRRYSNIADQPIFKTQKLHTKVTLEFGRPFLAGTLNPPHADGYAEKEEQRVWLDFITVFPAKGLTETSADPVATRPLAGTFITVGGEVKSPQRVAYEEGLTLSHAINAAGGFTGFATRKKVILFSGGRRLVVDMTVIDSDPSSDIPLKAGDRIEVPSSPF